MYIYVYDYVGERRSIIGGMTGSESLFYVYIHTYTGEELKAAKAEAEEENGRIREEGGGVIIVKDRELVVPGNTNGEETGKVSQF